MPTEIALPGSIRGGFQTLFSSSSTLDGHFFHLNFLSVYKKEMLILVFIFGGIERHFSFPKPDVIKAFNRFNKCLTARLDRLIDGGEGVKSSFAMAFLWNVINIFLDSILSTSRRMNKTHKKRSRFEILNFKLKKKHFRKIILLTSINAFNGSGRYFWKRQHLLSLRKIEVALKRNLSVNDSTTDTSDLNVCKPHCSTFSVGLCNTPREERTGLQLATQHLIEEIVR